MAGDAEYPIPWPSSTARAVMSVVARRAGSPAAPCDGGPQVADRVAAEASTGAASARTSATIASPTIAARGRMVTSERSMCARPGSPVSMSRLGSGLRSVETGFCAARTTIGSPLLMPPSMPPARFVCARPTLATRHPPRRAPYCRGGRPRRSPGRSRRPSRPEWPWSRRPAGRRAGCPTRTRSPGRPACPRPPPRTSRRWSRRPPSPRRPRRASPVPPRGRGSAAVTARARSRSAQPVRDRGSDVVGVGEGSHRAELVDEAPDPHAAGRQQLARQRAGHDPRRGRARRGALQDVADVIGVVLERSGQVDVARSGPGDRLRTAVRRDRLDRHPLGPVLPVAVVDGEGDGRAERPPVADTGRPAHPVALDLHAPAAAVAVLAPLRSRSTRRVVTRMPGRQALQHAGQAGAVRLAGGQQPQPPHAGSSRTIARSCQKVG